MEATIFSALLIGFLMLAIFFYGYKKDNKLPPGPMCLPLVGSLLFHGLSIQDLKTLGKKYGNIFTIYIGRQRVVVLNSYDLIREALVTNAKSFSDRDTRGRVHEIININNYGIFDADASNDHRYIRADVMGILQNLGFGKMEEKIKECAKDLVQIFANHQNEAFDPSNETTASVANVVTSILFSKRFEHDDEEFLEVSEKLDATLYHGIRVYMTAVFPLLHYVPSFRRSVGIMLDAYKVLYAFYNAQIQEHINSHSPGLDSDFVHAYLDKQDHLDGAEKEKSTEILKFLLRDLFTAGLETTNTSLKWLYVFMVNHPEIQEKGQAEIDHNIGRDRDIRLSDRDDLPYIEAIIWEMQRFKTIAPLSLPHFTNSGGVIQGFQIPKYTTIFTNLYSVHMNPETWGDPEVFRPERFIDENGQMIRHPHLIPFSMGKRQCAGEILARQELFLFTATLLQKFTFSSASGNNIDDEGKLGITFGPKPFQIRTKLR